MKSEELPNSSSVTFARAMADSTRQQIMKLCCCRWLNVNEIVEQVGVSQPTVSHHLAILREAGLVNVRSEGKHTYYSLNQTKIAVCCGRIIQTLAPEVGMSMEFDAQDDENTCCM